uniref:Uncharacterized protein n=1 Tax=Clastoptera arizonana TaxID=38151 RepID=A0A1B6BYH7_9HEMI
MKYGLRLSFLMCVTLVTSAINPKTLLRLSKKIAKKIEERKGDGEILVSELNVYYNYMRELLALVVNNTDAGRECVNAVVKTLGPLHTKLPIYNVLMTRAFNISFGQVEEIEKVIYKTGCLWNKIRNIELNRTLF